MRVPYRSSTSPQTLPRTGGSNESDQTRKDTIYILYVSRFGSNISPHSLGHHFDVSTHEPGAIATVSARFLSVLTGKPVEEYVAMGSREECLFNIEWEFPEYKGLPKATTRHLLKTESTSDISFSGGLDWVKKLLEQSVISSRDWTTTLTRTTITQPFPDFPFVVSYEPRTKKDHGDGQTSVYSEAPSATTSTTAASTDIPSNSSEMQNQNQNQTQHEFEPEIEALKQQWKQAKAFYARTGDMSEMGAVMARGNIILGLLSRTGGRGSEGCNCSLLSLRSIFYN